jgi:hypothetical protein
MKIAILTPAYDGRVHNAHARSVYRLLDALKARGDEAVYMDACHCANLPRLRNGLAAKALEDGADVLFWIDSDVGFAPDEAIRLVDSGEPIVGVAPQKRPHVFGAAPGVAFDPLEGGQVNMRPDGLMEVGKAATAFLCTRREVYEALAASAPRLANHDINSKWFRAFFWYELEPAGTRDDEAVFADDGEDYYFSRKAREAGFSILINPTGRIVHHEGRQRLPVSFWDLYSAQFQEAAQ